VNSNLTDKRVAASTTHERDPAEKGPGLTPAVVIGFAGAQGTWICECQGNHSPVKGGVNLQTHHFGLVQQGDAFSCAIRGGGRPLRESDHNVKKSPLSIECPTGGKATRLLFFITSAKDVIDILRTITRSRQRRV
jgi:hypothetical protein